MPDDDMGWALGGPAQTAHQNLAAANGVAPQAAVTAIKRGAPQGIPPSVGMTQPQYVNQVADQSDNSWAINNNPPVAAFIAKSPAHAAAASGSMQELAGVSTQVNNSYFSDFKNRWNEAHTAALNAWGEIGNALVHPERLTFNVGSLSLPVSDVPNGFGQIAALGLGARDLFGAAVHGVVGAPAGALGDIYSQNNPDAHLSIPIPGTKYVWNISPNSPQALGNIASFGAETIAQLALGKGAGKVGPREMPAPGEPPIAGPTMPEAMGRQPYHTGTAWNTNAEGFLADEDGRPVGFASPRDAASWRMQHGGNQVFEPDLHSEGIGLRDVEARPGDPYWEARRSRQPVPGMDEQTDAVLSERADADAATSEQIEKAVSTTPLHTQAPELMQEFLEGDTRIAGRDVQVDPFALRELYTQGHTPFKDQIEDIEDAMFRGTTMTVPYSKWLAEVSGKPFAEQVRAATVFAEAGISQDEAKGIKDTHASPGDTYASLTPGAGFSIKDLPNYTPGQGEIIDRLLAEKKLPPEDIKENPIPSGKIPHEVQFGTDPISRKTIKEKVNEAQANSTIETVALNKIRSPQRSITASVADKAEAKGEESVFASKELAEEKTHGTVEKYRGEYYVRDGNHRIVKLLSEGKTEGKFSVIDLDKYLNTGWRPTTEQPTYVPPKDIPEEFYEPLKTIAAQVEGHIDEIFKEQSLGKVFDSPKTAGMTKAQFERYSNALDEAKFNLREQVMQKMYNQIKKERTEDWKAAVKLAKEEAANSLNSRSNIIAYRNLRDPTFKLNSEIVREQYPEFAEEFPKGLQKKGGQEPDDIAELLGYPSGGELVKDMILLQRAMDAIGAKNIDGFVKSSANVVAQLRARELAGFDGSPEGIRREVDEAVTGPKMEDFLIAELKAIKVLTSSEPLNLEQIKSKAEDVFSKLPAKDAANIKLAERAVWKTGNSTQLALEKGDWVAAFKAKQQQLLNHYILRMSHNFTKEVISYKRHVAAWGRASLGQRVEAEFVDQIHAFLKQVGERVENDPAYLSSVIRDMPWSTFQSSWNDLGYDFSESPLPLTEDGKPVDNIRKASVEDFKDFYENLKKLVHVGSEIKSGLDISGNFHLVEKVLDAQFNLSKRTPVITIGERNHPNFSQKLSGALRDFDSWLLRMEQMFIDLDYRDPDGPFNVTVVRPLEARKNWLDDAHRQIAEHFKELKGKLDPKFGKWLKQKITTQAYPELIDKNGDPYFITKGDVVGAALHTGNDSNLQVLLRSWPKPVQKEVFAKLFAEHMTKDAWTYVQGMWDIFKKFKPELYDMYYKRNGVPLPTIKDVPFTNEHGSWTGGYYPVTRSQLGLPKGAINPDKFMGQENYWRARPANPHAKARTGSAAPLDFKLEHGRFRLNQMVHDIAYRDVLTQIDKFVNHPELKNAILRKYGPEYYNRMQDLIRKTVGAQDFDAGQSELVLNLLEGANRRAIIDLVGYSTQTIMKHGLTALSHTMATVGKGETLSAYRYMFTHWNDFWNFVLTHSPEVRNRVLNVSETARQSYLKLLENDGVVNWIQQHAFDAVAASDQFSAGAAWWAEYWKQVKDYDGEDAHSRATELADQAVRQAHGSSGVIDSAPFLRLGKDRSVPGAVYRGSIALMNFFNHTWNRSREIPQDFFGLDGHPRNIPRGLNNLIMIVGIAAVIEKEVGEWYGQKIKSWADALFHMPLSGIPFANEILADLQGKENGQTSMYTEGPQAVGRVAVDVGKGLKHRNVKYPLEDAANAAGLAFGLPGKQVGNTSQFLSDWATGRERNVRSPTDFLHGMITGPQGLIPPKERGKKK